MTEQQLINGLKNAEETAFRYILHTYGDGVYTICLRLLENQEDAKDVCQEVFGEVIDGIKRFKGDSMVKTWLFKIALYRSLMFLRQKKNRASFESVPFSSKTNEDEDQRINEVIERKDVKKTLHRAIESLPQNQQIAFTLCKLEGMNYDKASTIMNVSISSLESLLVRAKKNLKERLTFYYKQLKN